jgi:hypothetical protein
MTDLRRLGTTRVPHDDIEDAEFEEVDEAAARPASNGQTRQQHLHFNLMALGLAVLVLVLLALLLTQTEEPPASGPGPSMDAQRMLTEWSRQVNGQGSDAGLVLTDGPGAPGGPCDDRAQQFLRFGGITIGGEKGMLLYDAFAMGIPEDSTMIQGAFWFDPSENTVTIRNAEMFDLAGKPKRALPDSSVSVQPSGDGTLDFRGTKFHVCEMAK